MGSWVPWRSPSGHEGVSGVSEGSCQSEEAQVLFRMFEGSLSGFLRGF